MRHAPPASKFMNVHPESKRDRTLKNVPDRIPMSMLSAENAYSNHSQTLDGLNSRGGLGVGEILDVIHGRRWATSGKETQAHVDELNELIRKHVEVNPRENATLIDRQNFYLKYLIHLATKKSTCHRSRCGAIIIDDKGNVLADGINSKPCGEVSECIKDSLAPGFKSDKTCCVHAEQRAIMNALVAGKSLKGMSLYFLRVDADGHALAAGKPYCSICSKMALDSGLSHFALWEGAENGWRIYDTVEYNRITYQYNGE